MFPRLWKGLSFPVHQVTLPSPHTPHHPQPRIGPGGKANITLNYYTVTCRGARGCMCTQHIILCAFLRNIVFAVTLEWHKREAASRGGAYAGTQGPNLHASLLRSAEPCPCVLAANLRRSRGPGRHTAWGDASGAFVCAFTAGLRRAISIWVRAHGAAPAGVGEVTLRGHT